MILLDTNILSRAIEANSPHQVPALDAIRYLNIEKSETLVISPQVLTEFYSVSTRAANTLYLTPEQAIAEMENIKKRFRLLLESPDIFPVLESLIRKYKLTNRLVFDTRHVAFMLVNKISAILTFNDIDFLPFSEIQVLNPFDILHLPRKSK